MNEIEAIKHFNRVIAQLKYLDGGKDGPHLKYYIRVRNAKNRRRLNQHKKNARNCLPGCLNWRARNDTIWT